MRARSEKEAGSIGVLGVRNATQRRDRSFPRQRRALSRNRSLNKQEYRAASCL